MVGKYVFDSSTIILLAKVTILRSFSKAKETIITETVKQEVFEKKESEDAIIIRNVLEEQNIREYEGNIDFKRVATDFGIGAGEAEAITLAWKNKDIVATDDYRAIKACKALNIKFITAIHCLIFIRQKELIDIPLALEKLKKLEKLGRYTPAIIQDAQKIIKGENYG